MLLVFVLVHELFQIMLCPSCSVEEGDLCEWLCGDLTTSQSQPTSVRKLCSRNLGEINIKATSVAMKEA